MMNRLFSLVILSLLFTISNLSRGGELVYSTYLGGSGDDKKGIIYSNMGYSHGYIAYDNKSGYYITGSTESFDFPVTPYAYHTSLNIALWARSDVFITKLCIQPTFAPLYSDLPDFNLNSASYPLDKLKQ